jgi:hypothetical protein
MSILWQLLPFAIVFYLLVQLIPVRINLFFQRENKNDFLTIRVNTFFSLIRFNVEVPLFQQETPLHLTMEADVKAGEDELIRKTKQEISLLDINWKKVAALLTYIRKNRKLLWFISRFYWRAVTVEEFTLNIRGGTGDAAVTGMLVGLYWTAAGTVSTLARRWLTVKQRPAFGLKPDFRPQPELACRLDTTVSFRLGHFTVAGFLFLINQNPRGVIELWKNIRSRG